MSVTKIKATGIDTVGLTVAIGSGGPKITTIGYLGDDTATDPVGGNTITLNGSGFVSGAKILISNDIVSVVSFISSNQIIFISPAKAVGSYVLYLVNPDGGTAISVPGIQYSGTPSWTTAAGSLGTVYETVAISTTLAAVSDSSVTYSVTSGTLPPGITLNSTTGVISGIPNLVTGATTYNFTISAKDTENQDTTRSFSYTINPDVVSWSSPSAGVTLSGTTGTAFSQVLSATSVMGKTVSYSADALPTGLSISGSNITGTPSTTSSISSLLTATAASTNKTATRTITWNVTVPVVVGQVAYTTPGTYTWIAPANVTSVSVVAVGGGGGSGTNAGAVYTGSAGGTSSFATSCTAYGGSGGSGYRGDSGGAGGGWAGTGGGSGGRGSAYPPTTGSNSGGGGAGGYSGNGGNGVTAGTGASGGGVGILGQGANGTAGTGAQAGSGGGGGGGGDGVNGGPGSGGVGMLYGGGGGVSGGGGAGGGGGGLAYLNNYAVVPGNSYTIVVGDSGSSTPYGTAYSGKGAVRIIWGSNRSFPSTNTTDK